MIKALIVDDEPQALKGLDSLLKLFCPDVEVIGFAESVKSAVEQIKELKPSLVFLDIELKDGTGFDVLSKVDEKNFATIFVTAFDQYAIKALRLHAIDYLLKPADPEELIASVNKVKQHEAPDYTHLLDARSTGKFTKIGVPGSKGTIYLELKEIVRMESSNNYTYIYSFNTKPLLISKTIKLFEEILPEEFFIRCHQRHIVNIHFVKSYIRAEGAYLLLANNTQIPISRANRSKVDQVLGRKYPSL